MVEARGLDWDAIVAQSNAGDAATGKGVLRVYARPDADAASDAHSPVPRMLGTYELKDRLPLEVR